MSQLPLAVIPHLTAGLASASASLVAVVRRSHRVACGTTALTCAAVLRGWFVVRSPHLIGAHLTIQTAAASHAALAANAIAGTVVFPLVAPGTAGARS